MKDGVCVIVAVVVLPLHGGEVPGGVSPDRRYSSSCIFSPLYLALAFRVDHVDVIY